MNIDFNKNEDAMKLKVAELKNKLAKVSLGGGKEKIEKQHKKGKLTARERIDYLIDKKSDFLELVLSVSNCKLFGSLLNPFLPIGTI